jgi:hypothetical protein
MFGTRNQKFLFSLIDFAYLHLYTHFYSADIYILYPKRVIALVLVRDWFHICAQVNVGIFQET